MLLRWTWARAAIFSVVWVSVCGENGLAQVDWGMLFEGQGSPAAAEAPQAAVPASAPNKIAPPQDKEPARRPAGVEAVQHATSSDAAPRQDAAPPLHRHVEKEPPSEAAAAQAATRSGLEAAVAAPPPVPDDAASVPRQAAAEEGESQPVQVGVREQESEEAESHRDGLSLSMVGLSSGAIIDMKNGHAYAKLLTPGMQWALQHGWRLRAIEPEPIRPPRPYLEATERYSSQVRLGAGGHTLENYVAGQPFPNIDPNEPDAVLKMMWNFYYNFYVIDDVAQRNFHPRTGSIENDGHLRVERAYIVDGYRKMNYNGRLYVDPRPDMPNPEGVRFKESVHPIIEPFDLKGVGFTSYRYLDPEKQDDSWLYLPQLRRVRRMSSAQRSDALFGQDVDADAFTGYNGHIAWMDYQLLGEQVVLAPMHAQHVPAKWQEPQDWAFEDVWEPRRVWVIEARSKFPQYAYGKRILYLDQEAWLIPLSDSYDRAGQLWKAQVNLLAHKTEATPGTIRGRYDEKMVFQYATVIMDVQLQHVTSTAIPSERSTQPDTYLVNLGAKSGTTEDFFTVAHLIATGR